MKRMIILLSVVLILILCSNVLFAQDEITKLKEQIIDIQNKGNLDYRNFTLCTNIIGYGQYVPYTDNQVKKGTEIYIYYEPKNLFTNRLGGTYQIWFTQDIILLDANENEIYSALELLNFNYQTTSPVLDVYASNSLDLGDLPPGTYHYKAVMHDKLKKVDKSYTYTFEIIQ